MDRRGVTLIELLIVVLIISILAALVLGVAAVAGETARKNQTQHLVTRIHNLLTEHMATYKNRRVALRKTWGGLDGIEEQFADPSSGLGRNAGMALAEARIYAMREMIMMEVPDRWSDIAFAAAGAPIGEPVYLEASSGSTITPTALVPNGTYHRTQIGGIYMRKYLQLMASGIDPETLRNNQGAECLYMVVMNVCADGEARQLFKESEIGDTDGDGAAEFLDGWGHPVNFLRWAPGFPSQIQTDATQLVTTLDWRKAADFDHDPYDIYHVDHDAFRLVPLIYSPGRDESSGLVAREDYVRWAPNKSKVQLNSAPPYIQSPKLLPWAPIDVGNVYLGMPIPSDGTSTDNIHNHLLGRR